MPFFTRKKDKSPKMPQSPKVPNSRRSSQNSESFQDVDTSALPNGNIAGFESTTQGLGLLSPPPAAGASGGARPKGLLLKPDSFLEPASHPEGHSLLKAQTPVQTNSRLSKTLLEVLHDKDALPYFIQYMEHRCVGHFIRFWLDAESFQASSITRIRSQSLQALSQKAASPPKSLKANQAPDNVTATASPLENETVEVTPQSVKRLASTYAHGENGQGQVAPGVAPGVTPGSAESIPNSTTLATTQPSHNLPAHEEFGEFVSDPETSAHLTNHSQTLSHSAGQSEALSYPASQTEANCSAHPCVPGAQELVTSRESGAPFVAKEDTSQTVLPSDVNSVQTEQTSGVSGPSLPSYDCVNSLETASGSVANPSKSEETFQEKLRKSIERDAVNIYSKYISLDATSPIGISEELRNEAISKICREDGQVDAHCFESCQAFVVTAIETDYYPEFLQSEFHCKHQIDILTGSQVDLADVLYNDSAMFYFMEFMEQENAMRLLQCWLDLDNFQQLLASKQGKYDGMQAQEDAMVIYEKYFSLQATSPLGFDDKIRFEVECNICREEGPLPDCFTAPKRTVLRTLEKGYFSRYLTSEIYFKYLSDLITTVQTAQDVPQFKRKRKGSDCSSEKSGGSQNTLGEGGSISSKNTLLATSKGLSKRIDKALTKMNDDMTIDVTLFNPDALWKRPDISLSSMGRVNEVGQFVSGFDPEPDHERKNKGFFTRNKEKEKTQEEMALQIAQMIISDISQATHGTPADEEEEEREVQ